MKQLGLEGNLYMRVMKVKRLLEKGWKYDIIYIYVYIYKIVCIYKNIVIMKYIYFIWFGKKI